MRRKTPVVHVRTRPAILAITDNLTFEQSINWLLHEREFTVHTTRGKTALSALKATKPNAILLEVAPTVSYAAGTVKLVRRNFGTPIITLGKNESPYEIDYLRGAGADDHLSASERWTLVQCLRRCLHMLPSRERTNRGFPFLELDEVRMRVNLRGLPIELSSVEYALLARLMHRPYCIVSPAELLHEIRQHHPGAAADYTIRASIHHLRRKVEDDPQRPRRLVTVLGNGYVFRPDV